MYSVELRNSTNLKPAINWLLHNEKSYYEEVESGFTHYYTDAVAFMKKIKENNKIRWGYQIRGIPNNGCEQTKIYILFADDYFALAFKLMGF